MLVLGSRVTALEHVDGHVRVHVRRDGSSESVDARLVIGAFGSRWVPAIDSQPGHRRQGVVALGGEARVAGLDSEMVEVYLGNDVSPGWFGWVIPVEGGRARVGVGSASVGRSLRQHLESLMGRNPSRSFEVARLTGGLIPVYGKRKLYSSGMLMVGDAAGQVKPTSGGGIYTSIMAAKLSARVAAEALEKDDCSARRLATYQDTWQRTFHSDLSLGYHLRKLLTRLTPDEIDTLMSVLERPPIRSLVLKHGDIDLVRPLFLKLLKAPWIVRSLTALPASFWLKVGDAMLRWKLGQVGAARATDLASRPTW
jgi:flavin-dependent dehydrogenase